MSPKLPSNHSIDKLMQSFTINLGKLSFEPFGPQDDCSSLPDFSIKDDTLSSVRGPSDFTENLMAYMQGNGQEEDTTANLGEPVAESLSPLLCASHRIDTVPSEEDVLEYPEVEPLPEQDEVVEQVDEQVEKIQALRQEVQLLRLQLQERDEVIEKLRLRFREQEKNTERKETEEENLRDEVSCLRSENAELKSQDEAVHATITSLESQNADLQSQCDADRATISGMELQREALQEQSTTLRNTISELESKNESLRLQSNAYQTFATTFRSEQTDLKSQCEILQTVISSLKTATADLCSQSTMLKSVKIPVEDGHTSDLQSQVTGLRTAMTILEAANEGLKSQMEGFRNTICSLEFENANLKAEMEDKQCLLLARNAELERIRTTLELEQTKTALQAALSTFVAPQPNLQQIQPVTEKTIDVNNKQYPCGMAAPEMKHDQDISFLKKQVAAAQKLQVKHDKKLSSLRDALNASETNRHHDHHEITAMSKKMEELRAEMQSWKKDVVTALKKREMNERRVRQPLEAKRNGERQVSLRPAWVEISCRLE